MSTSEKLPLLARGSEQIHWFDQMLAGACASPERHLRGRAKLYAPRYRESFTHLCSRMQSAGYTIIRTPGIRGGEWGATYRAAQYVNDCC